MIQMNLFTKQKQAHRHRKQTHGYQREKGVGGLEGTNRSLGLADTHYYIQNQQQVLQHSNRKLYSICYNKS